MRWPSLVGGGKTVGLTPRQANSCSWNQRIGAFGPKNNSKVNYSPLFEGGSFANLASSSASNLSMVWRFEASVSLFNKFR